MSKQQKKSPAIEATVFWSAPMLTEKNSLGEGRGGEKRKKIPKQASCIFWNREEAVKLKKKAFKKAFQIHVDIHYNSSNSSALLFEKQQKARSSQEILSSDLGCIQKCLSLSPSSYIPTSLLNPIRIYSRFPSVASFSGGESQMQAEGTYPRLGCSFYTKARERFSHLWEDK